MLSSFRDNRLDGGHMVLSDIKIRRQNGWRVGRICSWRLSDEQRLHRQQGQEAAMQSQEKQAFSVMSGIKAVPTAAKDAVFPVNP